MGKKIKAMRTEPTAAEVVESDTTLRRKAIQKGGCPQCAVLLPEMERLRLDVKRLKEELSDARKQSGALKLTEPKGRPARTDAIGIPLAGGTGKATTCGVLGCGHPGYGR